MENKCSAGSSYSTITTNMNNSTNISFQDSTSSNPTTNYYSSSRKRPVGRNKQNIPDELARRRARNAEAARKSRARRDERMKQLENEAAQLSTTNNELRTRITVLEVEKKGLIERSTDRNNRIIVLESQLAETYQNMITK